MIVYQIKEIFYKYILTLYLPTANPIVITIPRIKVIIKLTVQTFQFVSKRQL